MKVPKICSLVVFSFIFLFSMDSYAHEHEKAVSNQKENTAGEVMYSTQIKAIFEQRCAKCHGAGSPEHDEFEQNEDKYTALKKGPRMDSYTYLTSFIVWPETGAIMRRLDDGKNSKSGKPGSMYNNLGDTDEERQENLSIFKAWIGNWDLKKWPDVTKKELDLLKVKY